MHVYPAPRADHVLWAWYHAIDPRYMKSVKWPSIPKFMEIQKNLCDDRGDVDLGPDITKPL